MNKLKEEIKKLYSDETLTESTIQNITENLARFFTLCLQITNQGKSPQEVQGTEQNIVQNENFMEK